MLKPQSAFFERHGSAGIAVLERTIAAARAAGALVLLDAKRGDIGSTAQAYADAYLRPGSPLAADALTVSPYLGFGSLRPFLDARRRGRRGRVRADADLQPRGQPGAAGRHGVRPHGRRRPCWPTSAPRTPPRSRQPSAVRLGGCGRRRHARRHRRGPRLRRTAAGARRRRPGRDRRRRRAGCSRASPIGCCRRCRATCSRPGPDAAALRAAALRHRDEMAAAFAA